MKLEVVIRESNSAIVLTAESEFEKEMLARAYKFKCHSLSFNINEREYYGYPPRDANVAIAMWNETEKS